MPRISLTGHCPVRRSARGLSCSSTGTCCPPSRESGPTTAPHTADVTYSPTLDSAALAHAVVPPAPAAPEPPLMWQRKSPILLMHSCPERVRTSDRERSILEQVCSVALSIGAARVDRIAVPLYRCTLRQPMSVTQAPPAIRASVAMSIAGAQLASRGPAGSCT